MQPPHTRQRRTPLIGNDRIDQQLARQPALSSSASTGLAIAGSSAVSGLPRMPQTCSQSHAHARSTFTQLNADRAGRGVVNAPAT
jgi:hypothetical protein